MRPVGDQNAGYAIKPITNTVLILINVAVFFYEITLGPLQLNLFMSEWGAVPAQISQMQNLITIFTAMFIHGSWSHLIGNMLFLKLFGDNIEDAMGHWSYFFFYLLCGVAATITQTAIDSGSPIPMVGASGAIAGVMGAYIMLFPKGQIQLATPRGLPGYSRSVSALALIGIWFLSQLFNGVMSLGAVGSFASGIAFWAHVGGFISGTIFVWPFKDQTSVDRQKAAQEVQPQPTAPSRMKPAPRRRIR